MRWARPVRNSPASSGSVSVLTGDVDVRGREAHRHGRIHSIGLAGEGYKAGMEKPGFGKNTYVFFSTSAVRRHRQISGPWTATRLGSVRAPTCLPAPSEQDGMSYACQHKLPEQRGKPRISSGLPSAAGHNSLDIGQSRHRTQKKGQDSTGRVYIVRAQAFICPGASDCLNPEHFHQGCKIRFPDPGLPGPSPAYPTSRSVQ